MAWKMHRRATTNRLLKSLSQGNKGSAFFSNGFKSMPNYYNINGGDEHELVEKNIIYLEGRVASPISYKKMDGRIECASTKLAVKVDRPSPDIMYIYLKFGRELAENAVEHVQKFDMVCVSGQISEIGEVHVGKLNFLKDPISRHFELGAKESIAIRELEVVYGSKKHLSLSCLESRWESLFSTPYKWYDCRMSKNNQKVPDFKHTDTEEALWITSHKNPDCVMSKLKNLEKDAFASCSSKEDLWKKLFTDPSKWFDNRKIKKSNKQPDFVHKDTRESLWVNDRRNPDWITPMLSNLQDQRFAHSPSVDHLWKTLFADPSKWLDNRKIKKHNKYPDFMHMDTGKALWIESVQTSAWVIPKLKTVLDEAFAPQSMEDLWKTFFSDPSKWFDDRKIKKSNMDSDFMHMDTRQRLWIDDTRTPAWVASMLNNLHQEAFASLPTMDQLWNTFFADPSKWFDDRKTKKSSKNPDFVHKDNGEALWLRDVKTPTWVIPMLKILQDKASTPSSCLVDRWKTFFADPSKWFDDRKVKKSYNHPDFVHKDTHVGLWIDSKRTPAWVISMLKNLQDEAFAPPSSFEELWKTFFADPSKWLDYRKIKRSKKHPDFVHKDAGQVLWIQDYKTPAWVLIKLNDLQDEAFVHQDKVLEPYEAKWKAFFESPSKWLDNRTSKRNLKAPDFKNMDTHEALWIDKSTPAWVIPELSKLGNYAFAPSNTKSSCKSFLIDQSDWADH